MSTRNDEVMSGGLAAVIGDSEPYVVASTRGDLVELVVEGERLVFLLAEVVPFPVPLTTLVDPRCGKWWAQKGERTSHCPACHHTFEGLTLFDAHQRILPNGLVQCQDPTVMEWRKEPLRLVEGTWRGPAMPERVLARVAS